MHNLVEDYKNTAQNGRLGQNYLNYLLALEKLSLKEMNTVIQNQNMLLDDKGKNSKPLWNYLLKLVNEDKITNENLKELCKMGSAYPKNFRIDLLSEEDQKDKE